MKLNINWVESRYYYLQKTKSKLQKEIDAIEEETTQFIDETGISKTSMNTILSEIEKERLLMILE